MLNFGYAYFERLQVSVHLKQNNLKIERGPSCLNIMTILQLVEGVAELHR